MGGLSFEADVGAEVAPGASAAQARKAAVSAQSANAKQIRFVKRTQIMGSHADKCSQDTVKWREDKFLLVYIWPWLRFCHSLRDRIE